MTIAFIIIVVCSTTISILMYRWAKEATENALEWGYKYEALLIKCNREHKNFKKDK